MASNRPTEGVINPMDTFQQKNIFDSGTDNTAMFTSPPERRQSRRITQRAASRSLFDFDDDQPPLGLSTGDDEVVRHMKNRKKKRHRSSTDTDSDHEYRTKQHGLMALPPEVSVTKTLPLTRATHHNMVLYKANCLRGPVALSIYKQEGFVCYP